MCSTLLNRKNKDISRAISPNKPSKGSLVKKRNSSSSDYVTSKSCLPHSNSYSSPSASVYLSARDGGSRGAM